MFNLPQQKSQVTINGKKFEADLERFCFVHSGSVPEVIPFHSFSRDEWYDLPWEFGMQSYEGMIEKMVERLTSCKVITSDISAMVACVCRYYESEELYEELAALEKKRSWIFKLAGSHDPVFSTGNREVSVKECPAGKSYMYDVVKKTDCCYEEVYRTNDFIFERIFIHQRRPQELPHGSKKKKEPAVKSKSPHPFFVTDYYRVTCTKTGKTPGVIHAFSGHEGLKEVHCNCKGTFSRLRIAAMEFIEGFGLAYYKRRLQCFIWTGEATYMVSKHHDPRSGCDPAFRPIHYVLVPDQEESRLKIQSRANGEIPGSMVFTGINQEVMVTYRGKTIATCQSPSQGLFLLELQKGANEIPF